MNTELETEFTRLNAEMAENIGKALLVEGNITEAMTKFKGVLEKGNTLTHFVDALVKVHGAKIAPLLAEGRAFTDEIASRRYACSICGTPIQKNAHYLRFSYNTKTCLMCAIIGQFYLVRMVDLNTTALMGIMEGRNNGM